MTARIVSPSLIESRSRLQDHDAGAVSLHAPRRGLRRSAASDVGEAIPPSSYTYPDRLRDADQTPPARATSHRG